MLSGIKRTAGTSVAARSARFNMLDCSSVRKRCLTPLPSLPDFQRIWNRFFVIYAPPLKGCWKKLRQPTGSCADWLYTHLMRCQPNLGYLEILHYHIYPIRMVRARHPSVQSFHPSFHQGHKLPSSESHEQMRDMLILSMRLLSFPFLFFFLFFPLFLTHTPASP